MAPCKLIIDTDPGVDDILAMLLAFSALPEELEILLLSVTYGNIDVQNCLRNVVSLFLHIGREIEWRKAQGKPLGFDALRGHSKPLVAVGPEQPLADQILMADYFHGRDGLGGIHETHPSMTPAETWKELFTQAEKKHTPANGLIAAELQNTHSMFIPSKVPADEEILRLLRENEPDTITIAAVGPLTNLAIAAAKDPETFLRVKEVVVMGGNVDLPGNATGPIRDMLNKRNQMTPVAEFNTFADTIAAARLYALSSPNPKSTMPPTPPAPPGQPEGISPPPYLDAYPKKLSRQLKVTLFPLDITSKHKLTRGAFKAVSDPLVASKSPLAEWTSAFLTSTFNKIESLQSNVSGDAVGIELHDPLTIWYAMSLDFSQWDLITDEDLRVETSGQWTRGMCIVDRRTRRKRDVDDYGDKVGDHGNWLSMHTGNRLGRCVGTPQTRGGREFGSLLMERIFGL